MPPNPAYPHQPELFKAIAEQIPDALIYADRDGVIRLWNRGAEALFGFPAAEAVGASLDIIVPERFRAAHWAGFHKAIESGQTKPGDPVRSTRSLHHDGRKLYADLSFGIVKDAGGAVIGAVAVGRESRAPNPRGPA